MICPLPLLLRRLAGGKREGAGPLYSTVNINNLVSTLYVLSVPGWAFGGCGSYADAPLRPCCCLVLFFASCCGCKVSPNKINPPLCNPSTCFDLVALASFSPCCKLLILSRRSARFGHERRWGGRLRCGGAIASMAMVAVNDGVEAAAGNVLVRLRRPCWSRRAMAQLRWSLRGLRAEAFPAETRSPRSPSMFPAPSWGLRAVRVPPGPGHGNVLCLSGGYRNGDGGHVCTRVGRTNRLQPKLELCSTSLRRLP